jgi:putative transposase
LNWTSLEATIRRLDKAYTATFRRRKAGEKAGFPKFINQKNFQSFEFHYGNGCRLIRKPGEPVLFRIRINSHPFGQG